ncbi:hypothetical protein BpHYR1_010618 [Brachionus plicatilis]|uniref:Uncharacterized protein n=1 Tax=Brachionus plicatilis TaxID=10195 RepID=A0A3M7S6Z8_BRAPC|nr:hypothetical protein BpHYR1_010618 [Brachionus plicatilis]
MSISCASCLSSLIRYIYLFSSLFNFCKNDQWFTLSFKVVSISLVSYQLNMKAFCIVFEPILSL